MGDVNSLTDLLYMDMGECIDWIMDNHDSVTLVPIHEYVDLNETAGLLTEQNILLRDTLLHIVMKVEMIGGFPDKGLLKEVRSLISKLSEED